MPKQWTNGPRHEMPKAIYRPITRYRNISGQKILFTFLSKSMLEMDADTYLPRIPSAYIPHICPQ
jgi:hypothetical protein